MATVVTATGESALELGMPARLAGTDTVYARHGVRSSRSERATQSFGWACESGGAGGVLLSK
jgi:hypothetical protein